MGRDEATGRDGAALARGFSQRIPRHLQPSVPAWDQAGPALPWWEAVAPIPSSPRRVRLDPGSQVSDAHADLNASLSPQGETGTGERGWTPMKRILLALGTLAALFAVAGATAKW